MTFDEALAALLPLIGERVHVEVWDQGEDVPALVVHFTGQLTEGVPMGLEGDRATHEETIYLRLETGPDTAAISLDRELYRGGEVADDGALILRGPAVAIHLVPVGPAPADG